MYEGAPLGAIMVQLNGDQGKISQKHNDFLF